MLRITRTVARIHCRWLSTSKNIEDIRDEFTQQSTWFENAWEQRSFNSTNVIMSWVLDRMNDLKPLSEHGHSSKVLDVACGTGIFARALAPYCKDVTGIDATEAMLEQARGGTKTYTSKESIKYICGDASSMPFDDESFDIVACRLAVHHFHSPSDILAQMVRVCKTGGRVVIVDITSPNDPSEALELNRLEFLRDKSHVRSHTVGELVQLLEAAGLQVAGRGHPEEDIQVFSNAMDLQQWMEATKTPPFAQQIIERSIQIELEGGSRTGMFPFKTEDGTVRFLHQYACVQGFK